MVRPIPTAFPPRRPPCTSRRAKEGVTERRAAEAAVRWALAAPAWAFWMVSGAIETSMEDSGIAGGVIGAPAGAGEIAAGVRTRLARHLDTLITELAGKPATCERHPQFPAHNCGCCRSERIGAGT